MIFGSTLLEVAIGIVFVYLLLSLLCSALSELLEAFIKYRSRDLEKGIRNLLDNPGLAESFFNHPLIKPLGENPSYIPSRTFSLALWNLATTQAGKAQNVTAGVTRDLNAIRSLIASLDDSQFGNIKTSLLTLMDEAGSDINKARANIEDWYNDAMDRVSGWYKRRVHKILIVLGLLAAAFLNIDTINIVKVLWYNDALRTSVVAAAEDYVKTNPAPTPSPTPTVIVVTSATPTPNGTPAATPTATPPCAPCPSPTATPSDETAGNQAAENDAEQQASLALEKINNIRGQINKLGLPIGWISRPVKPEKTDEKYKDLKEPELTKEYTKDLQQYEKDLKAYSVDARRLPNDGYGWFLKVLGIIITALAVSQGAPFWFDLLNKIIVIRSTIKPHEKSQEQPSKDKPAPETTRKQTENEDHEEEGENKG
jgi:cell division septation protein DedD